MPPYSPQPIDTSHIVLSGLQPLVEALVRNAHEIWALQRIHDGWTLGPHRDDARKQHPSLIPYEDLPDPEKLYDRALVTETLKAAMALGYRFIRD